MAMQSLFSRAVGANLPTAIPTTLERIDQFAIGKVLTYQKKPRRLLPWRRRELNFTGRSITDLLAEEEGQGQEFKFTTSSEFLFDAGKGTDKVHVEVGMDSELKAVLDNLDVKLHAKEQKHLSVSTDFGKITHIQTDLFEVLHAQRIKVNAGHPVIREAQKNGNTLFVISTLYQSERCNVEVTVSEKDDGSASATGTAEVAGGSVGGSVDESRSSVKVVTRDQSTVIAYLLLRMTINAKNELVPKLNNRLDQASDPTRVDMIDAPTDEPDGGAISKKKVPRIDTAASAAGEWVIVDMVKEGKAEGSVKNTDKKSAAQSLVPPLTSLAQPTAPGELASLGVPSLDQHYVYSLKEFQCFASNTYGGVVEESKKWIRPVRANQPLREAFLAYAHPPNSHQKLKTLSEYLQESGSALRTGSADQPTILPALEPITTAMSTALETRLNETTSLIVISEACLEFPQHVIKMIFELKPDKRELLLDVIKRTPNGVGRHVFMDDKPFDDPALYPIMRNIGYDIPEKRLEFTSPDNIEDDILAAAIVVILISEN